MDYYENEITPYDDVSMTYNDKTHRYTLTLDFAEELTKGIVGLSFLLGAGSEAQAKYKLEEYSSDMYKYIYKYNRRDESTRRAVEHLLAKNGDLRDTLRDTMADMLRADVRSGYNVQKDLLWANPERGTVMDLSNVPGIAPDAIDGLMASGILHKGGYTYSIDDDDYRSDY